MVALNADLAADELSVPRPASPVAMVLHAGASSSTVGSVVGVGAQPSAAASAGVTPSPATAAAVSTSRGDSLVGAPVGLDASPAAVNRVK